MMTTLTVKTLSNVVYYVDIELTDATVKSHLNATLIDKDHLYEVTTTVNNYIDSELAKRPLMNRYTEYKRKLDFSNILFIPKISRVSPTLIMDEI